VARPKASCPASDSSGVRRRTCAAGSTAVELGHAIPGRPNPPPASAVAGLRRQGHRSRRSIGCRAHSAEASGGPQRTHVRASKAIPRHTRCRDTAAAHADRRRRGAIPSTAPRRAPAGGTASHTNLSRLVCALLQARVQAPPICVLYRRMETAKWWRCCCATMPTSTSAPSRYTRLICVWAEYYGHTSENENRNVPDHVSVMCLSADHVPGFPDHCLLQLRPLRWRKPSSLPKRIYFMTSGKIEEVHLLAL